MGNRVLLGAIMLMAVAIAIKAPEAVQAFTRSQEVVVGYNADFDQELAQVRRGQAAAQKAQQTLESLRIPTN